MQDAATGQYYAKARYFTTGLGRWSQPEPILKGVPGKRFLANPQMLNPYVYCVNNPVRYMDPDGKTPKSYHQAFKNLNATERSYYSKHRLIAIKVAKNTKIASDIARNKMQGSGEHNGRADAVRHTLWCAMNTQSVGDETAKLVAAMREATLNNPADEQKMDEHNNAVGIKIGQENPNATTEELTNKVIEALENGDLVVLPDELQGDVQNEGETTTNPESSMAPIKPSLPA